MGIRPALARNGIADADIAVRTDRNDDNVHERSRNCGCAADDGGGVAAATARG